MFQPSFNGLTSYLLLGSGLFNSFSYDEFTITVYAKVTNAAVWTTAQARYLFRLQSLTGDAIYLRRDATVDSSVTFGRYTLADGDVTLSYNSLVGRLDTIPFTITGSIIGNGLVPANTLQAYIGSTLIGSIGGLSSALGGGIAATYGLIGALRTISLSAWLGSIARVIIYNRPINRKIRRTLGYKLL